MFPVAILAGGLGTRLGPLTEQIPKALVPVCGKPFLVHQLDLLRRAGVERVVLCIGHLGNRIREVAGDGSEFGLQAAYSDDGPLLRGTAGAIRRAIPHLGERFFVLYGDSYLTCDFADVQRSFEDSGMDGLMTVFRNEGQFDTSNIEFASGAIRRYDKVNRTPEMRHIDYGLGVFDASAFRDLPEEEGAVDLSRVYQTLLSRNRLAAYEVTERFYEIGSVAGIRDLEAYLCRRTPSHS
jgi:N-acetyl-alpha-D-muramate 1-phosphate uridylyltransferase